MSDATDDIRRLADRIELYVSACKFDHPIRAHPDQGWTDQRSLEIYRSSPDHTLLAAHREARVDRVADMLREWQAARPDRGTKADLDLVPISEVHP